MTYRPEIDTFSGSTDISEDVIAFDFEYGLDMLSTDKLPERVVTAATMLLENLHGEWGADELDMLGVIERRWGTDVLFRGVVLDHEFDKRDGVAMVKLQSASTIRFHQGVAMRTVVRLSPADILAAAGITITPETPLPTDINMEAGVIYSASASDFVDDFAVFMDAYIYENHLGELRLLQKTDSRDPSLTITADDFDVEFDTAESLSRRGWRRDAQALHLLDITLDSTEWRKPRHELFSENMPGNRVGRIRHGHVDYYFDPLSAQNQAIIDNFRFYELNDLLECEGHHPIPGSPEVPPFTADIWINGEDPTEVGYRLQTIDSAGDRVDDSDLLARIRTTDTWTVTIRSFPTDPEEHAQIVFSDENNLVDFGMLPPLPWAVDPNAVQVVDGRVQRAAETIPNVVKLVFPVVQDTEAQFRSLVEHRIGSVSDVTIVEDDLQIRGHYALLFVRMRWEQGRYNSIEMHFLKLRDAERHPLFFESADQPIYFETEDQPVEIQP